LGGLILQELKKKQQLQRNANLRCLPGRAGFQIPKAAKKNVKTGLSKQGERGRRDPNFKQLQLKRPSKSDKRPLIKVVM